MTDELAVLNPHLDQLHPAVSTWKQIGWFVLGLAAGLLGLRIKFVER